MPSSVAHVFETQRSGALSAAVFETRPPSGAHFGVVPFRRDAQGAIVPGSVVEVPNGDIAWRRARAEAFEHDNVGAVALFGSEVASSGTVQDGILIARFGDVDLALLKD